jgi:hypothetical protein
LAIDGGLLPGILLARDFSADFCVLFLASRQRDAQTVAHRGFCRLYRGPGNLVEFESGGKLSDR